MAHPFCLIRVERMPPPDQRGVILVLPESPSLVHGGTGNRVGWIPTEWRGTAGLP